MNNRILNEDMRYIYDRMGCEDKFQDSTILITGCGGFLGYYFLNFFGQYAKKLGIKKLIGLDNFMLGKAAWVEQLESMHKGTFEFHQFDVIKDDVTQIPGVAKTDFVLHMASIASPVFYRKFPIETLDANITGLRRLLDFCKDKELRGFLFFSSSEVYGDPVASAIPTSEEYRGNVSMIGPRACYDEAKRFGETMSYLFAENFKLPISVCRPFNNYGPGMKLDDRRVPADFANAVFNKQPLNIYSDGKPTRTFCYIADAIVGYLKVLTYGKFDVFNIGIEKPEISIAALARIYENAGKEIFGYDKEITFAKNTEANYLTDNPNRRCPNITKAKTLLNYHPEIGVEVGVSRFLEFLRINHGRLESSQA